MTILFQVALLASFVLALVSVASGARGAAPAARLATGPADEGPPRRARRVTHGGLSRGFATLGLALTPSWQRTRLVVKLNSAGRPGPGAWHAFLAMRGALAFGALASATVGTVLWRPSGFAVLAAGAWLIWRWQESRIDRVERPTPPSPAAPAVELRAIVPKAAPEPAPEPGEGPLTQRLRRWG